MTKKYPRYEGEPEVKLLNDGRNIELLSDFSFIDPQKKSWNVPKKAVLDGASIPRFLWAAMGGPLDGIYRNASIIHDWYCDRRTRTWQATHRVFYEAMLVSDVDPKKALVMYWAVRWGGPRWEERVSINTGLILSNPKNYMSVGDGDIRENKPIYQELMAALERFSDPAIDNTRIAIPSPGGGLANEEQMLILAHVKTHIENSKFSAEAIEHLADSMTVDGKK